MIRRAVPLVLFLSAACVRRPAPSLSPSPATDMHGDHPMQAAMPGMGDASGPGIAGGLPADAAAASARIAASPRHGEWVMIAAGPGGTDSVRAWVVYPERRDRAPVIVVVHEIFGLSTWIRGVADQLAAEGYVAVAPDFLSGKHLAGAPDNVPIDSAVVAIRTLRPEDVQRQIEASARWAMALPAALPKYGVVGFCWGGGVSFEQAVHAGAGGSPLAASVVYYGTSPASATLASVRAPVLGLYGQNDARVDMTIPPADSALKALGRTYTPVIYPGAGHGFLRQQDGQGGANMAATRDGWARTIAWFRRYLGA